jgi:hypothetical protein
LQLASEAQLHVSARNWRRRRESRAAVGAVGAVDAVCVLGAGAAVVAEGVGGVERHPLARPPKGTQSKSLDAAVA